MTTIPGEVLDKVQEQNLKNIIRKVQSGKTITKAESELLNKHRQSAPEAAQGDSETQWHKGLTEKQRRFCEAYSANGGNALGAARDAGYKHPDPEGCRQLGNARIQVALEFLRKERTVKAILSREERQAFWTEVVKNTAETMRDRLRASELLGKSQTDFIERHEVKDISDVDEMTEEEVHAELDRLRKARD